MPRKALFEQLESRQMLAANVTAYVAFRDLYIQSNDADAKFRVTSLTDGSISIESLDANTRINGQKTPTTINGRIDDLLIELGSIRNAVELTDLYLPDQLSMTARWGGNDIRLDNVYTRGDTIINHLKGNAELSIIDSVFNSSLSVFSNEGHDSLQLINTDVRRNLSIYTGRGNDDVAVISSSVGQLANLNTTSAGRELFTVADRDHVCLIDDVFTSLSLSLGNDADRLDLATTVVTSKALLDGGTEFDTLGQPDSNSIAAGSTILFEFHTYEIECDLLPDTTLFTNPSDPLLLRSAGADGSVVEYFGRKDTNGLAVALEVLTVQSADGVTTIIEVDGRGRPTKIVAPTGETIGFQWLTDSRLLASAISADGSVQANVVIDLTDPAFASSIPSPTHNLPPVSIPSRRFRGFKPLEATVSPNPGNPSPILSAGPFTSLIDVTVCGMPSVDSTVMIAVKPDSGLSFNVPARHVGGGQYAASIPTPLVTAGATDQAICGSVIDVISACFLVEAFPPGADGQISAALAAAVDFALGGSTDEGLAIFAACEAGIRAYQTACTLNIGPDLPATRGILDAVCANMGDVVERAVGGRYSLTPTAFVPGQGTFTAPAKFASTNGPFPNFSVRAGNGIEILSFTTSPADPGHFQSYVATIPIACAFPGTTVTLSIVGTDGYTDSVTTSIVGNSDLQLFVPGAESGTIDVITISVAGGDSRTISFVL